MAQSPLSSLIHCLYHRGPSKITPIDAWLQASPLSSTSY
ncbi:hypothetical protein WG66_009185, partial [Moniliophthora roreri]